MGHYSKEQIQRLRFRHRGYFVLLVNKLLFLLLLPLAVQYPLFLSVLLISLAVVLMGFVVRYSRIKRQIRWLYALGFLAIALEVLWHLALVFLPAFGHWLTLPHVLVWTVFFFANVLWMIQSLIREPFVTVAVVMGAAQGYLLIGIAGGVLLNAALELHPSAFDLSELTQGDPAALAGGGALAVERYAPVLMAASFNLLTTVGSGVMNSADVTSQVIVTVITVSGQLYVAILISLILGRFHTR
tara:strand:- start:307 stop:1035 length:729 start_codon:yes stop_codon:yes gene_type:complete